jgi:hypothetical protein
MNLKFAFAVNKTNQFEKNTLEMQINISFMSNLIMKWC